MPRKRATAGATMAFDDVMRELHARANVRNVEGMRRFGIRGETMLGISVTELRKLAKTVGRDHALAQALWQSGVHEARILAPMVEEMPKVTKRQLERWVRDVDSWDVCDGFGWGFVDQTPFAVELAHKWSSSTHEFVKRAAFSTIAGIAVHDKTRPDKDLLQFLPVIRREAGDERNFVRKAVNWALRQIGKRSRMLNAAAIACAEEIRADGTKAGRWVAADALRELCGDAVQARLRR